jgi:hypothetical protein
MRTALAILLAVAVYGLCSTGSADAQTDTPPGILPPTWGENFVTCAGAHSPVPLKAVIEDNPNIIGNGIINCTDEGDNYTYRIDYMNFSLSPTSTWRSAHLEWFGCGAQRAGPGGRVEWLYDEARPIKVVIVAGVKRVAITNIAFRIPKPILSQARGLGFYVAGGGIVWSIFLL